MGEKNVKETKKEIKLKEKLAKLQKDYDEQNEILKRAQHDYINLKFDFDRFQKQVEEKDKELETNSLISSIKKFLPFVEDLRKSLNNIPEQKKKESLSQGLQLVYDNFLKTLEGLNIKQIDAVGLKPDSNLHEPVGVQTVKDKKLKGKIIQEFERGFVYNKDNKQKVLNTSKVIVGQ